MLNALTFLLKVHTPWQTAVVHMFSTCWNVAVVWFMLNELKALKMYIEDKKQTQKTCPLFSIKQADRGSAASFKVFGLENFKLFWEVRTLWTHDYAVQPCSPEWRAEDWIWFSLIYYTWWLQYLYFWHFIFGTLSVSSA